jgi:hypothetical protein
MGLISDAERAQKPLSSNLKTTTTRKQLPTTAATTTTTSAMKRQTTTTTTSRRESQSAAADRGSVAVRSTRTKLSRAALATAKPPSEAPPNDSNRYALVAVQNHDQKMPPKATDMFSLQCKTTIRGATKKKQICSRCSAKARSESASKNATKLTIAIALQKAAKKPQLMICSH